MKQSDTAGLTTTMQLLRSGSWRDWTSDHSVGISASIFSGANDRTNSRNGARNSSYLSRQSLQVDLRNGRTRSGSNPASCIAGRARWIASNARFAASAGSGSCSILSR